MSNLLFLQMFWGPEDHSLSVPLHKHSWAHLQMPLGRSLSWNWAMMKKVWGQVQTSEWLCHPQSKVLVNHFFLANTDGMKALIALANGEGLEPPGSCRKVCSVWGKSKHRCQNATLSDSSSNVINKQTQSPRFFLFQTVLTASLSFISAHCLAEVQSIWTTWLPWISPLWSSGKHASRSRSWSCMPKRHFTHF